MVSQNGNRTLLVLDCGSKLFDKLCSELDRQHIPYICRSLSPIRYCDHIVSPRIRSVSDKKLCNSQKYKKKSSLTYL